MPLSFHRKLVVLGISTEWPLPATLIDSSADFSVHFTYTHTSGNFEIGFYVDAIATGDPYAAIAPDTTQMKLGIAADVIDADDLTADTAYQIVIEKVSGITLWRIKGGTEFATWTELYRDGTIVWPNSSYLIMTNTDAVVAFADVEVLAEGYTYSEGPTRFATFRVKSAGATTFDPTITTSSGTATWLFGDGTTEVSNAPSKAYASAGDRLARMTGVADANVLSLDSNTDSLFGDGNNVILPTFTNITTLYLFTNSFTGDLSGWSLPASLVTLYLNNNSFTGDLSGWSLPASLVNLYLNNNSFTGDLSGWSLPASLVTLYLYSNSFTWTAVTGMDSAALDDFRIQNNALSSAHCDNIVEAMYNYRASYTSATPTANIAGTNAAPGGIYQDGDPPTTGKEYIFELVNDPEVEGFNQWVITFTA